MQMRSKVILPLVAIMLATSTAIASAKAEVESESCKPITIIQTITLYKTLIVDRPVIETHTVTISVDRPIYVDRIIYETKTVTIATDTKKLHRAIFILRNRYLLLAAKYKKLAKAKR